MRLFTGIELPEDVCGRLNELLERLRPTAHLQWTPSYNLHVTMKFIGEWPDARVPELLDTLKPLGKRSPIPIQVEGVGWFPNPHNPRILWTGIKAGPELSTLAADTDNELSALGIEREKRPFSPHITLARIKNPVPLAPVLQAIAHLATLDFGKFTIERFHLYLSKPGPSGSIYTQLAEFPLISE